jgi:hypothetical protein
VIHGDTMHVGRGPTALPATALSMRAVAAVAAACHAGGPDDSGAPPSVPPPPPPTGQPDDEPLASMRPNEVAVEPAVGLRRVPWTLVEAVGTHRLRIHTVLEGGPPCAVLGRVDVHEDADAVRVTLWIGRRPDARCDGPQRAVGFPIAVTVDLRAPLGTRRVHDGA